MHNLLSSATSGGCENGQLRRMTVLNKATLT